MTRPGANQLDPDERHTVHNERVRELIAGEISGKEFVKSLIEQVGFSEIESRRQYQDVKTHSYLAIDDIKSGSRVSCPHGDIFLPGKVTSLYGSGAGAICELDNMVSRFPFSLFELRVGT